VWNEIRQGAIEGRALLAGDFHLWVGNGELSPEGMNAPHQGLEWLIGMQLVPDFRAEGPGQVFMEMGPDVLDWNGIQKTERQEINSQLRVSQAFPANQETMNLMANELPLITRLPISLVSIQLANHADEVLKHYMGSLLKFRQHGECSGWVVNPSLEH